MRPEPIAAKNWQIVFSMQENAHLTLLPMLLLKKSLKESSSNSSMSM